MTTLAKVIAEKLWDEFCDADRQREYSQRHGSRSRQEEINAGAVLISSALAAHSAKLQRLVTAAHEILNFWDANELEPHYASDHEFTEFEDLRAALAEMKEVENGNKDKNYHD